MIASLAWKEFRQQRNIWLGIAFLAILLNCLYACAKIVFGTGTNTQLRLGNLLFGASVRI